MNNPPQLTERSGKMDMETRKRIGTWLLLAPVLLFAVFGLAVIITRSTPWELRVSSLWWFGPLAFLSGMLANALRDEHLVSEDENLAWRVTGHASGLLGGLSVTVALYYEALADATLPWSFYVIAVIPVCVGLVVLLKLEKVTTSSG